MPMTFADCYRTVRLHAAVAPVMLCREWVQTAWKDLAQRRSWSFLRGETNLIFQPARTGLTVSVTQLSATVTAAGSTTFSAADRGRQFRVAYGSTYTILTVATDGLSLTLDRAYAEDTDASGTALATINDTYVTLPADFGSFRVIPDTYNQRQIAFWIHEDQLQILDPRRAFSDTGPRILIPAPPSTDPTTLGQARYEAWPRPTAARTYVARYNKQAARLSDDATFTGVLADGGEVVIAGALARAASWPGTIDQRNPLFNLALAQTYRTEFEQGLQRLSLKDDNESPDDTLTVHWERWPIGSLAYNDHALRASDAGTGGYF